MVSLLLNKLEFFFLPCPPPPPPLFFFFFFFFFLEFRNVPCTFLEVKTKPFPLLQVKSKPCSLIIISRARKPDFCRKSRNALWKNMRSENSCIQKQQILRQNAIFFQHGETLIKQMNNFWCCDRDCALTATHSSEKFNTRMFINIHFKIVSPLPQKRLMSPLTAILFLYWKVLTERVGTLLMLRSGLCVDCYRIM